jgi:ATP-binding cassette subfamily F protein uup
LSNKETPKKRRLSTWEKREFDNLEAKIAQLEAEKATVETMMTNATAGSYTQVQKLYEQAEKLKQDIDKATERWMELAEMES